MKTKRIIACYLLLFSLLSTPVFGALPAAVAWDVRPGVGSDNNGGGFVTGASGTDRSQSDTPFCNNTDLVLVTATTATSAACPFSAASVGNLIQITAGTNFTTGFYQVVSVATVTATLDRAAGTLGSTGGTFALGGALATIPKALTANVASNKVFVKASGVITITAGIALNNNLSPSSTVPYNVLQGYTTTRTDMGRVTIEFSTNAGIVGINQGANAGWLIQNFNVDCKSLASSTGVQSFWFSNIRNVKASNCTSRNLLQQGNYVAVTDSEFTGCTSACDGSLYLNGISISLRNYVHDNVSPGIRLAVAGTQAIMNLVTNNSGAASDGIIVGALDGNVTILNNTVYASGRDGINMGDRTLMTGGNFRNNLLVGNARYGFNGSSTAGAAAWPMWDGNAYFNNTTANRNNMDDTGSVNAIDGAAPYTNTLDVILSADPFTNAAGGDFTLNNTAGGGAAAKNAGTPGALLGATGQGYMDIGIFQAQAGGGGGSSPTASAYVQ